MRKMLLGFGSAALVAALVGFFANSASAANVKPCWAHSLDGVNYSAVWATGGGHPHSNDVPLGDQPTAADCQLAFDAL
jgi:hypothetical protein